MFERDVVGLSLGCTQPQPPIHYIPGASSSGVKSLVYEADYTSLSTFDVKNVLVTRYLIKRRDNVGFKPRL
jgi:hypothetical protein